jgi:hypothetical protein
MVTKTLSSADILLAYAEKEYAEKGDRFATAKEMEMYRQDPRQMFTNADANFILIEFIKEQWGRVEFITVQWLPPQEID